MSKYADIKSPAELAVALEEGRKFVTTSGATLSYDKTLINPFQFKSTPDGQGMMDHSWAQYNTLIEIIKPDIFEYVFEGSLIISNINGHRYYWDETLSTLNVRLPTIEETPTNTMMLWHPSLGMPEGLDEGAKVIVWYDDGGIGFGKSYGRSWHSVRAFMIVE